MREQAVMMVLSRNGSVPAAQDAARLLAQLAEAEGWEVHEPYTDDWNMAVREAAASAGGGGWRAVQEGRLLGAGEGEA